MDGDGDGGRRRRRAAAPVFDPSTSLPTTRSSRSSAAHAVAASAKDENSAEDSGNSPLAASRSSRPVRASRSAVQHYTLPSDVNMELDNLDKIGNGDEREEEEDYVKEDHIYNDDPGDEEYGASTSTNSRQRPSRRRTSSKQQQQQQQQVQQQDDGDFVHARPMRQRSSAQLRNDTPPRRTIRINRSLKAEDIANEADNTENAAAVPNLPEDDEAARPRAKRVVRAKGQSSPVKNESVQLAAATTASNSHRRERLPEEIDGGWIEEIEDDNEARQTYTATLTRIRVWLHEFGNAELTSFLESMPKAKDEQHRQTVEREVTLQSIERSIEASVYASSIDFEQDMLQLFRNGRRYFHLGSKPYGGVVTLQRMYNHITQSVEAVHEQIDEDTVSRNYSSIRYGPCQEPEGQGAGESPCVGEVVDVLRHFYKGKALSVGMWVHLSNPTDPARPIVAQIFKTRTEDLEDRRQDWITACWFPRPEQTRHPRTMTFWENEVIKSNQMVEHHVEDVLEVVCVNFYTKAARGTPADGEGGWHVGDPLYICENRYQAPQDAYFKIKNWASCLPDEVRNKRFNLVEYDQPIVLPEKLSSPFLRGVEGPGEGLTETRPITTTTLVSNVTRSRNRRNSSIGADESGTSGKAESDVEIPVLFKEWRDEVQAQRRAMLHSKAQQKAASRENKGVTPNAHPVQQPDIRQASFSTSGAHLEAATPTSGTPGVQGSPVARATSSSSHASASPSSLSVARRMPPIAESIDRSLMSVLGQTDVSAYFDTLPEAMQRLFHQDPETGKTVWYPAPPIVGPTRDAVQRKWNDGETLRGHSLDYLYHLATNGRVPKRRRSIVQDMDVDAATTKGGKGNKKSTLVLTDDDDTKRLEHHHVLELHGTAGNDAEAEFHSALRNASTTLSRYITVPRSEE